MFLQIMQTIRVPPGNMSCCRSYQIWEGSALKDLDHELWESIFWNNNLPKFH